MRILLTGSSGLIGRNLLPRLRRAGHQVMRLLREPPAARGAIPGDAILPDLNAAEPQASLEGFEAVIHLAGQNVDRRWTKKNRASILASREDLTARLCQALARTSRPPAHFLSASATGYYGFNHPGRQLTETAPNGDGFLAEVCEAWESGTRFLGRAHDSSSAPDSALITQHFPRVALMRLGVVLTPEGGALAKMLPVFRKGLGGVLGSGRQMMSWVALPDLLKAIEFVLNTPTLAGPVNICSPHSVSNRQFTRALATALHRPAFLRVPKFALMMMFGQMAKETILSDLDARPARLLEAGFTFAYPTIDQALIKLLDQPDEHGAGA